MTYRLYIGNRMYFSWSLAAYLMFNRFGLADQVQTTVLRPETEKGVRPLIATLGIDPARTLPTVITPEGAVLNDTMAIAEELATRHPDHGFWPQDPHARATARALAYEMHASFSGLRSEWAVNLRTGFAPVSPPDHIAQELDRLEQLWTHARTVTQHDGPWLCGAYSLVDAIFAPMAARIATYGFDTRPATQAYVAAHLTDPALRRWRAMALANEARLAAFECGLPEAPWPGPKPLNAKPISSGTPENDRCPYSGDPITDLLEINGRIFGFCNPFCRDKTVNDPEAWPQFMALFSATPA